MTTKYITNIGIFSLGKIFGAVYGIMGLIFGAILTITSIGMGSMMEDSGMAGLALGIGAIVALPIFYGIMGLVVGILTALVYNIVAGFIGGLEIEVE
jgi:hypothetical protein